MVRVFLLAGQSNAYGNEPFSTVPVRLQTPNTNHKIWNGSAFVTLENGVNGSPLAHTASNWGAEAELLYQASVDFPSEVFYLVKYGVSATQLYNSGAQNWHPDKASSYFDGMKGYVTAALAALVSPQVEAVFWYQGESDANDATRAAAYETNLEALLTAASNEWGCREITKYIVAKIYTTDTGSFPYVATVRAAQEAVVAAEPITRRIVETSGMSRSASTNVHLNADGYVECGQAFWTAYKQTRRFNVAW